MGDALKRTRTTVRHEYVLAYITNTAEVAKAVAWAEHDWVEAHPGQTMYDDSIKVSGHDEGVVVWWEQEVPSPDRMNPATWLKSGAPAPKD